MSEGTILDGRYRLGRPMGRGSMGSVFHGQRLADGRHVAIKRIHDDLVRDAEVAARFEREIDTTAAIRHPGIVEVLDHGDDAGGLFLVMEYLAGRTLSQVVAQEGPLEPGRVADIGRQLAEALRAAHGVGLVHRDLKPENVMVLRADDGRETVKVMDFGLAVGTNPNHPSGARMTAQGLRLGTPAFMAPEYISSGEVDHRSDLYAIGLMLYELACGELPFTGQGFRLMQHHLHTPPPPLGSRCAVPAWLAEVVDQLLAKAPDDRVQSAAELVVRLQPPENR